MKCKLLISSIIAMSLVGCGGDDAPLPNNMDRVSANQVQQSPAGASVVANTQDPVVDNLVEDNGVDDLAVDNVLDDNVLDDNVLDNSAMGDSTMDNNLVDTVPVESDVTVVNPVSIPVPNNEPAIGSAVNDEVASPVISNEAVSVAGGSDLTNLEANDTANSDSFTSNVAIIDSQEPLDDNDPAVSQLVDEQPVEEITPLAAGVFTTECVPSVDESFLQELDITPDQVNFTTYVYSGSEVCADNPIYANQLQMSVSNRQVRLGDGMLAYELIHENLIADVEGDQVIADDISELGSIYYLVEANGAHFLHLDNSGSNVIEFR